MQHWQLELHAPFSPQSATTTCCYVMQAMAAATEQMMQTRWRPGAQRDIYADFNALTLDVTTRALFGSNLQASDSRQITGESARHAYPATAV